MDLSSPEKGGLFELDHFISLNKKQKGRNLQSCVRAECFRSEGNARPCSARPDSGPGCGEPHGARRGRAAALRFSRPGRRRPLGIAPGKPAPEGKQRPQHRVPGRARYRFPGRTAAAGASQFCGPRRGRRRMFPAPGLGKALRGPFTPRPRADGSPPRSALGSAHPRVCCASVSESERPQDPRPEGRRRRGARLAPVPRRAGQGGSARVLPPSYRAGVRLGRRFRRGRESSAAGQGAPRGPGPTAPSAHLPGGAGPARLRPRHVAPAPRALLTCAAAGRARCPPAALKPGPGSRGGAEPRPARLCWGPARSPRRPVPVPQSAARTSKRR